MIKKLSPILLVAFAFACEKQVDYTDQDAVENEVENTRHECGCTFYPLSGGEVPVAQGTVLCIDNGTTVTKKRCGASSSWEVYTGAGCDITHSTDVTVPGREEFIPPRGR